MSEQSSFIEFKYFNTYNTITAFCPQELLQEAVLLCGRFENLLSKTVEGSDVWRINHACGAGTEISEDTMTILRTAEQVSHASGGAFNIAIGDAVSLWRFTDGSRMLPDPDALAVAVHHADYTKISLSGHTVTVPDGMKIDLGGIAKGYITDRVADFLRDRGVQSALLNFGGNVVTVGGKPDGTPWSVGLQRPFAVTGEDFFAVILSRDSTIVTSAVYERGFNLGGKRYHHILDPRSGYPVENDVVAVTLFGKDSLLADALSTACFVLGIRDGSALATRFRMEFLFIDRDGKIYRSASLPLQYL